MKVFAVVILFFSMLSMESHANRKYGFGHMSCEVFLQQMDKLDQAAQFKIWVEGFLTAFNGLSIRTDNILGYETAGFDNFLTAVKNHCRDIPVKEVAVGPVVIQAVEKAIGDILQSRAHTDQLGRLAHKLTSSERDKLSFYISLRNWVAYMKVHEGNHPATDEAKENAVLWASKLSQEDRLLVEDALATIRLQSVDQPKTEPGTEEK